MNGKFDLESLQSQGDIDDLDNILEIRNYLAELTDKFSNDEDYYNCDKAGFLCDKLDFVFGLPRGKEEWKKFDSDYYEVMNKVRLKDKKIKDKILDFKNAIDNL